MNTRILKLQTRNFRIMPDIVSKLLALASKVPVLFNWNLSRCTFLRQVVDLDLLFCTAHVNLFLYPILTQRTMNDDWKIEGEAEHSFGLQQVLAHSIEIPFP